MLDLRLLSFNPSAREEEWKDFDFKARQGHLTRLSQETTTRYTRNMKGAMLKGGGERKEKA